MSRMEPEAGVLPLPGGETIRFLLYRSDRRVKSISLRVRDDGTLAIRAPYRTGKKELFEIVTARAEWISRGRNLVAERLERPPSGDSSLVPYLGGMVPLPVELSLLHEGDVRDIDSSRAMTPAERQRRLEDWYLASARRELPPRVERLGPIVGAVPSSVVVSRQRAAWGSCARDGTIRLSWRLMMLRQALIDAVIIHELCHLHHHNHSLAFWQEVERVSPDYRALRAELRAAQRTLPF